MSLLFVFSIVIFVSNRDIQQTRSDSGREIIEVKYDTRSYSQLGSEHAISESVHSADKVIEGEIEDISYVINDGIAWTRLEVNNVKNLINGRYEDKILIYVLGGYINTKEYNAYYNVNLNGTKVHAIETKINNYYAVGKKIMAILAETDPNSPFEKFSFEGLDGNKSVYLLDHHGYYTYNENDEKCYLSNEDCFLLNIESR